MTQDKDYIFGLYVKAGALSMKTVSWTVNRANVNIPNIRALRPQLLKVKEGERVNQFGLPRVKTFTSNPAIFLFECILNESVVHVVIVVTVREIVN